MPGIRRRVVHQVRPSCVICLLAVWVATSACGGAGHHASRSEASGPMQIVVGASAPVRASFVGGSAAQRRLLRTIVRSSGARAVRRVRIVGGRRSSGPTLQLLMHRTDKESSTQGKWLAILIGRAFANASEERGLPVIRTVSVVTPGIQPAEGRRMAVRLRAARPRVQGLSHQALLTLAARARTDGVDLRRLVLLHLGGTPAEAVAGAGVVRRPAQYLRILTRTATAPPTGLGAYYELRDASGAVAFRFGLVNGVAPRSRLVAWVRPQLLRAP